MRKRVFNIHFRNINGGLMNFQEVVRRHLAAFKLSYNHVDTRELVVSADLKKTLRSGQTKAT